MPQLLIELFCEEIPARMQLGAARDFERLFASKFQASGLSYDAMKAYVSPRRLTLVVDGLPAEQAAVTEEVKGPKDGASEQAMAGFLRKVGLTQDQLVLDNGVWMARIEKPGRKTVDALPDMLREVILAFPWPKSMRSGTSTFRWVRPLQRILFLFDGAVVPFGLENLEASNLTEGHRFLGSGKPFAVSNFASYTKGLRDNFVILDHAERQAVILERAKAVCAAAGCELMDDPGLLEEVAGLNEWPVPILGDMDPQFLSLPPEVIKTSMRTHQKYFAVRDSKTSKMAAHFVIVANIEATDGGVEIKRGNAKVLSARLSDGVFFWKEDNKPGNFDRWLERLKGTTFHVKLGTMAQRVERIVAMARYLAPLVGVDADTAAEAARLAKGDLASKMVGEFPELQGVMGGYYADALKLDSAIADAIREHYKPQGPSDSVPAGKLSAVVALADKFDTLIGFFAIDEKPTGSKDPYALRRSALGILRIIREHGLRLPLVNLIAHWHACLLAVHGSVESGSKPGGTRMDMFQAQHITEREVVDFFTDRLKVQLKEDGRRLDVLDAVLALRDGDFVRAIAKIDAVEALLATSVGDDLLIVAKRTFNILSPEIKKNSFVVRRAASREGANELETRLFNSLVQTRSGLKGLIEKESYVEALNHIAALRQDVDAFLDGLLVNSDDEAERTNRLNILYEVSNLGESFGHLSKII